MPITGEMRRAFEGWAGAVTGVGTCNICHLGQSSKAAQCIGTLPLFRCAA